jgi:hypothetical protein
MEMDLGGTWESHMQEQDPRTLTLAARDRVEAARAALVDGRRDLARLVEAEELSAEAAALLVRAQLAASSRSSN